jgi:hypothetical protein
MSPTCLRMRHVLFGVRQDRAAPTCFLLPSMASCLILHLYDELCSHSISAPKICCIARNMKKSVRNKYLPFTLYVMLLDITNSMRRVIEKLVVPLLLKEVPRILWKAKIGYRHTKSPPLVHILNQISLPLPIHFLNLELWNNIQGEFITKYYSF